MTRRAERKILFLADHWRTLDHDRDSTLHMAQVARESFGFECHWAHPQNVFVKNSEFYVAVTGKLAEGADRDSLKTDKKQHTFPLNSYHSIHWRHDPPVKLLTLRLWSLLATQANLKMLNAPNALLTWNEKFSSLRFKDWCIPSNIISSVDELKSLKLSRSARWLAKPVADAASRGVFQLSASLGKMRQQIEKSAKKTGPWIVIQEQDPKIFSEGETRLFLLNRKIVGCLKKISPSKEKATNPVLSLDAPLAQRPLIEKALPSKIQKQRASAIAQALAADGVLISTVDFIGDRILEINVTSPGMIRWMDAGVDPKKQIAFQYWKMIIDRFGRAR